MRPYSPFLLAVIYAAAFSTQVCVLFYGGLQSQLNYSYLIGLLAMLPFVALSIWLRRKDSRAEIMTGRIAMREGLKFTIAATLLLCIFQIVFFYQGFHDYKCDYIRNAGPKILSDQIDHGHLALKKSDIPKMIEADIQGVTPFREITSVVFKNVLFGAFASFLFSLLFKRRATK